MSLYYHLKHLAPCNFTMSESYSHIMPATQQCSLILPPPFHCTVWQPASPKYASRHVPLVQRKRHSTTHRVQSDQPRDRCIQRGKSSTTAWHSRRRSLSRLGLVDHTAHHITNKTQIGPVQVVPILYRKHLASIIIRIGTSGAMPT